jgi:prolipoprotein diacylglyceryltransferase
MRKNIIIAVLVVVVIWLVTIVIRLGNFHYGSLFGMCSELKADDPEKTVQRRNCVHAAETRTSPLWRLFYALSGEP